MTTTIILYHPKYIGACYDLCTDRRGVYSGVEYRTDRRPRHADLYATAMETMDFFDPA